MIQVVLLVLVFAAGFVCGTISQKNAEAQLKQLGQEALQKAAGSGGAVGSVVELGTAISEMQQHVDGLQKNLGTLRKVQNALGG